MRVTVPRGRGRAGARRVAEFLAVAVLAAGAATGAWSRPATLDAKRLRAGDAASAKSFFRPREFPHLLGAPAAGSSWDGRGRWEAGRTRGNARIHPITGVPSVLRDRSDAWPPPQDAASRVAVAAATAEQPDTVRIAAFRVDFLKDSADFETTGDGRFDMRDADSSKVPIDPPPHNKAYFESHLEALRRYYDVQTHGGLVLEYTVFPAESDSAYHLPDTDRYGPWLASASDDSILARAHRFVTESIEAADRADPEIPWKRFDSFLVFHAGADLQGDARRDTNYDIPSFNLFLEDSVAVTVGGPDSVKVNFVMVVPETVSQDEFLGALNGVMAHEFAHQLGFFDLYNVLYGTTAVGVFSLMDAGDNEFGAVADPFEEGNVVYVRGVLPASLDPFHRMQFFPGTVTAHEAPPGGDSVTVSLPGVLIGNDLLRVPMHLDEYLLVENRPIDYNGDSTVVLQADSTTGVILGPADHPDREGDTLGHLDYDFLLPKGGVLVWHIDERAAVDGLLTYGGVNVFDDRRGVDVEEADGIQDIGTASSEYYGGPLDSYYLGGFTRYGPDTNPNSDTNDGTPTGIHLAVLDSVRAVMRVRVGDPGGVAGWPLFLLAGHTAGDGLTRVDLDLDGFEEVIYAGDDKIIAWTAESPDSPYQGSVALLGTMADTVVTPPAATRAWGIAPDTLVVVAAVAGGQARWFDASGQLYGRFGGRQFEVTAGPIPVGGRMVVGCNDGSVRAARQGGIEGEAFQEWVLRADGVEDSITAIAAGRIARPDSFRVFAGSRSGALFAGVSAGPSSAPSLMRGWPVAQGAGSIASILWFRASASPGEDARDLVLASSHSGRLDLRTLDGALFTGWPVDLGDSLAGTPAVGDPDGDGLPEIVATTRGGSMHLLRLDGFEEAGWPRSLWAEFGERSVPTRCGPRLWDVAGDGSIEIVQLRGDGIQQVWNASGGTAEGWPLASGSPGSAGPVRVYAPSGEERWFHAHALSDSMTAVGPLALRGRPLTIEDARGCFPMPQVDIERSGVLRADLGVSPEPAAQFFDAKSLILHPNPLRGDLLTIRYVAGAGAQIEAEAFDLSGRPRLRTDWRATEGAGGGIHQWDLSGLASGVYVVRLRVRGGERTLEFEKMLAIVR